MDKHIATLEKVYSRIKEGDFYDDYDDATKLLGEFREAIAAIALMRGQSERVLIAHAVASDLAALHAVPALSRTMMTIRCSADPVADRKVPIYVFPPEKPKDTADEQ